jgi:hypothetical protein
MTKIVFSRVIEAVRVNIAVMVSSGVRLTEGKKKHEIGQ